MSRQLDLSDGLKQWLDSVEKSTAKMNSADRYAIEDA